MRTQIMHEAVPNAAWLEYDASWGDEADRVDLESFPFIIGRLETASLTADSSRVSREHVSIEQRGASYVLRDLGSTNGTFLNGERVDEVVLADGDAIMIADLELVFRTGEPIASERCVTQVMPGPSCDAENESSTANTEVDLLLEVRRAQEVLHYRAARSRFHRIYDLQTGSVFGLEVTRAVDAKADPQRLPGILQATECRLTERLQELHRLLAAEKVAKLESQTHLFFTLLPAEVGAEWLPESLLRLREVMQDQHQIVVQIPDSAVCDIPFFRTFITNLRHLKVQIAYDGFQGNESRLADLEEIAPDYVRLAPLLVRDIGRSSGGQRQVQLIVRACRALDCEVVIPGISNETEAEIFVELGCRLAQGDLYGASATVSALSAGSPLAMV